MDTLLRFGNGAGRVYYFEPDNQVNLANNFANMVTATGRLPGASGGFNQYGRGVLPSEVGSINYSFWLYFDSPADAITKRDALMQIADWGQQQLFMSPQDLGGERWCWASINNIDANFNAENMGHKRLRVTITFHVPDPFWLSYPFDVQYMDNGLVMDDGLSMSGWTATQYILSAGQTLTVNVEGSARALPTIFVETAGAQDNFFGDAGLVFGAPGLVFGGGVSGTVDNFSIARVDTNTLRQTHYIGWDGMLNNSDALVINVSDEKVVYRNSSAGDVSGWNELTRTRATMMILEPGANRVDIGGDFTGTVLIRIEYLEVWR